MKERGAREWRGSGRGRVERWPLVQLLESLEKLTVYLVYMHVYPCCVSNRLYFLFMRERVLRLYVVSMSCRVRLPDCVSSDLRAELRRRYGRWVHVRVVDDRKRRKLPLLPNFDD